MQESLPMNWTIETLLLLISVMFLVGMFAGKAGYRFGAPILLMFLCVGMLFGNAGIGLQFSNYAAAQTIGTIALCLILFSGGLSTKFNDIKPIAKEGTVLATVGVLLTAFFLGGFFYLVASHLAPGANITLPQAMLLGAVISSTDSASVFAILRDKGVSLRHKLRPLLEFESGSNDPMAYLLTITLIEYITLDTGGSMDIWPFVWMFCQQLILGVVLGLVLGYLLTKLINKIELTNDALYPVLLFTCGILIFSLTYLLKGNGFLAIYVGGVVMGNSKFIHKRTSLKFYDGLAWLGQITMFLVLGLLVNPFELANVALWSLIVAAFMIFAARPLAVLVSMLPFRKWTFRDRIFISWVGLKGAVPIIFAILPLMANVPNAHLIFNVVFFCTLLSLLVQGTTLTRVANWLGLAREQKHVDGLQHFDMDLSEDMKSTMSEIELTQEILDENGTRLMDLPLPDQTLAVMIKRKEKYLIPTGRTPLIRGDKLLVITKNEAQLICTYESLGITDYSLKR